MTASLQTWATGKVILLGEHAVVYGFDAIAMSLDRGATVQASPHTQHELQIPAWDTTVSLEDNNDLARALSALVDHCKPPQALRLVANVDIPPGAGLGCSAALGTAVARALLAHEPALTSDRLFEASQTWERIFHGAPSGIDARAAQGLGAFRFSTRAGVQPLKVGRSLHFVVCHSGASGSTREMVAQVASLCGEEPKTTKLLHRIGAHAVAGERALAHGDVLGLGATMNDNHRALQELGVSTARLDLLCEQFISAGACGAKLTGSGGGGCVLALFEEHAQAEEAAATHQLDDAPCFALSVLEKVRS